MNSEHIRGEIRIYTTWEKHVVTCEQLPGSNQHMSLILAYI